MLERRRLESEIAELEVIPPRDTRRRLSEQDTMTVPYRWICVVRSRQTDSNSSEFGMGTGVLIGPRHVLTSAHVLVSERNPSKTVGDRVSVQPARNGRHEPFKAVGIRGWKVHPQWIVKRGEKWVPQPQYDYGLITLKEDISRSKHRSLSGCYLAYWGAPGICGARSKVGVAAAQIMGQEAHSAGYPGDRPHTTLWEGTGRITLDRFRGALLHTIDTYGGQSGAPVWLMQDGVPCLAGIHSRPGVWSVDSHGRTKLTHNIAVLITPDILRQLEAWKGTFSR